MLNPSVWLDDVQIEKDGKWVIYSDLDRLEEHMKELAPEDTKVIHEFISGARGMARLTKNWKMDKAPELYTLFDNLKMMLSMVSFMPTFLKFRKVSSGQYARRFKNTFLRRAFTASFAGEFADFAVLARQGTLAFQHTKQAGCPVGGSLEFVRAIEKRYLGLGGQIHYRSPVAKILVENNQAVGVRLLDGTEYGGDIVISDELNHGSIIDGVRLTKAERMIYKHKDMGELETRLKEAQAKNPKRILGLVPELSEGYSEMNTK
jgi:phytoene dehydrogenase-like protein